MMRKLFGITEETGPPAPREGDLFKIIEYGGQRFELRYGYYEEKDRKYEPLPIYPNFIQMPVYSDDGRPFATAIQHPCRQFKGKRDENSTCEECRYYQKCEELLGICTCEKNKKPARSQGSIPRERSENKV